MQEINLQVGAGELLAIVGESGSGKSVTAMAVLQLLPRNITLFTNGTIRLEAEETIDLIKASPKVIQTIRGQRVAMIFQEPMSSLNPVMHCGAQVEEAILAHQQVSRAEAKRQALELFEQVQLPEPAAMLHRYPHQLSGGQKQRVMIAMAISCKPDVLICDEPTTALDVTVQRTILELIKQLQVTRQMGVIFITHDLGVVGEIADRILVLYKGKIVETGTTADIFLRPAHPYTRALLACRPGLYPKHQRLPVVSDFMNVLPDGTLAEKTPDVRMQPSTSFGAGATIQNEEHPAPLLYVENLNVWYPVKKGMFGKPTDYFKAVNDITFTIYKGETLGLVGESGCGKTTLGRAILQLITPTAGKVIYDGRNITQLSKKPLLQLRREMQIIFQDPYGSLNPRLTIGDAIAEPLQVHKLVPAAKERKEKVVEWLEKVNLKAEHYNRYPHEFSGGQRQRIVIARALIMNPKFVICDESVSALDVSIQAQVLNLLHDLKQEMGFTSIFISHDLGVVHYTSDRIMVMRKGKIEETGRAEDVYYRPQSAYTQQLINAIPGGIITP